MQVQRAGELHRAGAPWSVQTLSYKLGQALAAGRHGERDELMASTAAYSGLRWGAVG